jgi:hypothetical protein
MFLLLAFSHVCMHIVLHMHDMYKPTDLYVFIHVLKRIVLLTKKFQQVCHCKATVKLRQSCGKQAHHTQLRR